MRNCLWILFALMAAFHVSPAAAQAVFDLRCDKGASPKGVKNAKPQFSWSVAPTATQRGYQVLVASSEEKLKADEGDLWDSGRVMSDKKQVEYKGKPLPSLQRCYWKVRIWGNYYTATSWSEAATFQTGVLPFEAR